MSNVSVEFSDENTALVSIKLDDDSLKPLMNKFFEEKQKTLTLKGFRKGKAPLFMVASHYKAEAYRAASDQAIQSSLMRGLSEHKLMALGDPVVVKLDKINNELICDLSVEIMKPIMLKKYLGLDIKKYSELDLTTELDQMLVRMSKLNTRLDETIVLDEVKENCYIGLDFTISEIGVLVEENKDFNLYLNTGMVYKPFEEKLIGNKLGDNLEFDIEFPAEFGNEKFNGKLLHFNVIIKSIKSVAALSNEELAKSMSYTSFEELKAQLEKEIVSGYETKKLQLESVDKLIQCPVHTIEPFALMLAPAYILMKLNQKLVSVKAPLDFLL